MFARWRKIKRPAVLSGTEGQLRGTTLVAAIRRPLSAAITGGPGDGYARGGSPSTLAGEFGTSVAGLHHRRLAASRLLLRVEAFAPEGAPSGSGRIICSRHVGPASRVFPWYARCQMRGIVKPANASRDRRCLDPQRRADDFQNDGLPPAVEGSPRLLTALLVPDIGPNSTPSAPSRRVFSVGWARSGEGRALNFAVCWSRMPWSDG